MVRREAPTATAGRDFGTIGSRNTYKCRIPPLLSRPQVKRCAAGFSAGKPMWRAASLLFFSRSHSSFKPAGELGERFCRGDDLSGRLRDSVYCVR